jgi:hypothetical protein
MKAAMVAVQTGRKIMSQFIAPNELHGMNEQELRALRGRIMADLRSMGQSVFLNPNIYASLQNIDAAIQRLQQQPKPRGPKPPGF